MNVVPLVFSPHFKTVIWGGRRLRDAYGPDCPEGPVGEAWIVSSRADAESRIQGGPYHGLTIPDLVARDAVAWLGRDVVAESGPEFPLLVKIIDAATDLSMQVHPDERMARELGGEARAKTECWWILAAEPDARLYLGLKPDVSDESLRAGLADGAIEDLVESHALEPGDFFFVPSGAVHAIGGGVSLLEIQETSDTTYRLYDWGRVDDDGRPRELHVEQALQAARGRPRGAGRAAPLPVANLPYARDVMVRSNEFTVERLRFERPVDGRTDGRRFHLAVVLEGRVRLEVESDGGSSHGPFSPWTPILLPADLGKYTFHPDGGAVTLALTAPGKKPLHVPASTGIRLQKVLAAAGVGSRRECERMIAGGRVTVDGDVVEEMGTRVDPERQEIHVDGERLRPPEAKAYYLLNKPRGVVCTNHDEQGRVRAIDLIPGEARRIFTIGRLDVDSEGAILLTNDGEFSLAVAHPRYGVPKVYLVQVRGRLTPQDLERLSKGVWLSEGKAGGFEARVRRVQSASTWLRVTMREGKNREIRRVFARLGFPVKSLKRARIGHLSIKGLKPGDARRLTPDEVERLRQPDTGGLSALPDDVDDGLLPRLPRRRPGTPRPGIRAGGRSGTDRRERRGGGRRQESRGRPPRRDDRPGDKRGRTKKTGRPPKRRPQDR